MFRSRHISCDMAATASERACRGATRGHCGRTCSIAGWARAWNSFPAPPGPGLFRRRRGGLRIKNDHAIPYDGNRMHRPTATVRISPSRIVRRTLGRDVFECIRHSGPDPRPCFFFAANHRHLGSSRRLHPRTNTRRLWPPRSNSSKGPEAGGQWERLRVTKHCPSSPRSPDWAPAFAGAAYLSKRDKRRSRVGVTMVRFTRRRHALIDTSPAPLSTRQR